MPRTTLSIVRDDLEDGIAWCRLDVATPGKYRVAVVTREQGLELIRARPDGTLGRSGKHLIWVERA